ncbi:MAG TPA: N-acetyltransferase [Candidatus Angelobacter sp.]|nr:N-acetyltransferase [Candidatus Angelobacter sp.]
MSFRDATAEDADAIAHLHAESWRSAYRGTFSDDFLDHQVHQERAAAWNARFSGAESRGFFVLLAESAGQIEGFACVFPADHAIFGSYVDNLHVQPKLTGRGLGRRLLSEVARRLMAEGFPDGMYLWVVEQNQRALRFYERAGAKVVGSEIHTMPDGQNVRALRCHWPDIRLLLL